MYLVKTPMYTVVSGLLIMLYSGLAHTSNVSSPLAANSSSSCKTWNPGLHL